MIESRKYTSSYIQCGTYAGTHVLLYRAFSASGRPRQSSPRHLLTSPKDRPGSAAMMFRRISFEKSMKPESFLALGLGAGAFFLVALTCKALEYSRSAWTHWSVSSPTEDKKEDVDKIKPSQPQSLLEIAQNFLKSEEEAKARAEAEIEAAAKEEKKEEVEGQPSEEKKDCLLYTSPSPRDRG